MKGGCRMIRAYDEYGNIADIVEWEKHIREIAIDDFVNACEKQFTAMYGQRYVDMRDIVNIAEQLKVVTRYD